MAFSRNFKAKHATLRTALATLVASAVLFSHSAHSIEPGQFYRFTNEEGVKVISSSIPPKYAQKGYEIISRTGQVVKTVAAAPDPEEAAEEKARLAKQRELMAEYEVLARRYSSEKEIYAARDRRLAHLNANIALLKSNISNLQNQVDELMTKAAGFERSGRKVPAIVLQNLEETRAEMASTESMLDARIAEHDEIFQTFEDSVTLYKQGKVLQSKMLSDGNIDN